jgi:hypothetical protein
MNVMAKRLANVTGIMILLLQNLKKCVNLLKMNAMVKRLESVTGIICQLLRNLKKCANSFKMNANAKKNIKLMNKVLRKLLKILL